MDLRHECATQTTKLQIHFRHQVQHFPQKFEGADSTKVKQRTSENAGSKAWQGHGIAAGWASVRASSQAQTYVKGVR